MRSKAQTQLKFMMKQLRQEKREVVRRENSWKLPCRFHKQGALCMIFVGQPEVKSMCFLINVPLTGTDTSFLFDLLV